MPTPTSITVMVRMSITSYDAGLTYHEVQFALPRTDQAYTGLSVFLPYDPTPGLVQTLSGGITSSHPNFSTVISAIATSLTQGQTYSTPMDAWDDGVTAAAEYPSLYSHNGSVDEPLRIYNARVTVNYSDAPSSVYQFGNVSVAPIDQLAPATIVGTQPVLDASEDSYVVVDGAVGYSAFLVVPVAATTPPLRQIRNDGLALGTKRVAGGSRTVQGSLRRAGGTTY